MSSNTSKLVVRWVCAAAVVGGVLLLAIAGRWCAAVALEAGSRAFRGLPWPPADALLTVVAGLAALGLAWLVLALLLEALARAPGALGRAASATSRVVTPRLVRRAVGVVVGVGLGAGLAGGPAMAGPARVVAARAEGAHGAGVTAPAAARAGVDTPDAGTPDPSWGSVPDPGWVPRAPAVRPPPDVTAVSSAPRRPGGAGGEDEVVVVHRGDSLWSIAARHLGPGATDAEIAAAWPVWHAANRSVIGPDPDLLLPGQVLRPPGPEDTP